MPKGPGANPNLAATSGYDNVQVKPLVKHVLSKELQLYFERICGAILDDTNDEHRNAALASLRTDPGLHQLVPYFFQFVAEKVTHNLSDLFTLTQVMHMTSALLDNPTLFKDGSIGSVVPSVLTCLIAKRLGPSNPSETTPNTPHAHYALRDLAGALLVTIARQYGQVSRSLKPRLVKTCLKTFLDPNKPFAAHYGAIVGLSGVTGPDGVQQLLLPNLVFYDGLLKEGLGDESRRQDAEMVVTALLRSLVSLAQQHANTGMDVDGEDLKVKLSEKVGEVLAERVMESGNKSLAAVLANADVKL